MNMINACVKIQMIQKSIGRNSEFLRDTRYINIVSVNIFSYNSNIWLHLCVYKYLVYI